ncbi:MAG: hypothetical protein AAF384_19225 [Pseudomonadota bacterium]
MAAAVSYQFDDSLIKWLPFGTFEGLAYTILDVDVDRRTADVMFKFEPNRTCFYHRHVAASTGIVVAGIHHVYEIDEDTGEKIHHEKPVGSFTKKPGGDVHIEGGGPEGCTVFMHMEADTDLMYEVLDDDLSLKMAVSIQQFKKVFDQLQAN